MVDISNSIYFDESCMTNMTKASDKLIITLYDGSIIIKKCDTTSEVDDIYNKINRHIKENSSAFYELTRLGLNWIIAEHLAKHIGIKSLSDLSRISVGDLYTNRVGKKKVQDAIKILHNNGYRLIDEQNWGYENL